MTDGHDLWKMTMYAYRAAAISKLKDSVSQPGNIPHRPSFIAIHHNSGHNLVMRKMQQLGMTTLAYDKAFEGQILQSLPDMMGMSEKEIAKFPPYIQYFKCNGGVESGDPGCGDHKFNNSLCEGRKAKTSWHPGWKYHALTGNLLAMTILEVVADALQNLAELEPEEEESITDLQTRLQGQLKELDKAEAKDYANIFNSPIPEGLYSPHVEHWWEGEIGEHLKDMDIESFLKEPIFCHAAILPAEIRFLGLLTENFTHTTTNVIDQTYEQATLFSQVHGVEQPGRRSRDPPRPYNDSRPERDGQMMLLGADGERQHCDEHLNLDYKDYYFASNRKDWQSLTLPNKSEQKYYREFNAKKSKGWIIACLGRCEWGNCAPEDMGAYFGWKKPQGRKKATPPPMADVVEAHGTAEMTINGVKITEASNMHQCLALKHGNSHVWEPNDNGQYEIKVRVTGGTDWGYIRFSSFIFL
jgi:hypothetical protein